ALAIHLEPRRIVVVDLRYLLRSQKLEELVRIQIRMFHDANHVPRRRQTHHIAATMIAVMACKSNSVLTHAAHLTKAPPPLQAYASESEAITRISLASNR